MDHLDHRGPAPDECRSPGHHLCTWGLGIAGISTAAAMDNLHMTTAMKSYVIFKSYVSLPEGIWNHICSCSWKQKVVQIGTTYVNNVGECTNVTTQRRPRLCGWTLKKVHPSRKLQNVAVMSTPQLWSTWTQHSAVANDDSFSVCNPDSSHRCSFSHY